MITEAIKHSTLSTLKPGLQHMGIDTNTGSSRQTVRTEPVKILILEHDLNDLELLQYELRKMGIPFVARAVRLKREFVNAMLGFRPDVILSDYSLPSFDGIEAFELRQSLAPSIPFIFVSGNIEEEYSLLLMQQGLTDYVRKDNLLSLQSKLNRILSSPVG